MVMPEETPASTINESIVEIENTPTPEDIEDEVYSQEDADADEIKPDE